MNSRRVRHLGIPDVTPWSHLRHGMPRVIAKRGKRTSQYGGATVIATKRDNDRVLVGVSICSMSDQFCKRKGEQIAQNRIDKYEGDGEGVIVILPRTNRSRYPSGLLDEISVLVRSMR